MRISLITLIFNLGISYSMSSPIIRPNNKAVLALVAHCYMYNVHAS